MFESIMQVYINTLKIYLPVPESPLGFDLCDSFDFTQIDLNPFINIHRYGLLRTPRSTILFRSNPGKTRIVIDWKAIYTVLS